MLDESGDGALLIRSWLRKSPVLDDVLSDVLGEAADDRSKDVVRDEAISSDMQ